MSRRLCSALLPFVIGLGVYLLWGICVYWCVLCVGLVLAQGHTVGYGAPN
jgi:hypothetical protein